MYINTCMSYALMLFEELFASQLSVPSSPVHPIKCTTVQMKKKKYWNEERTEANERGRKKCKDKFRHEKRKDNKNKKKNTEKRYV